MAKSERSRLKIQVEVRAQVLKTKGGEGSRLDPETCPHSFSSNGHSQTYTLSQYHISASK